LALQQSESEWSQASQSANCRPMQYKPAWQTPKQATPQEVEIRSQTGGDA
jgi:hypothetical protein